MMRSHFDIQLSELSNSMITIGMLCETAIARSSRALLACDAASTGDLPALLAQITEREREIEAVCLRLLLRQQPVAGDFRLISSVLKMVTDAQRIGTQSCEIARILALGSIDGLPEALPMQAMADAVIGMVTKVIDAFVRQDIQAAVAVIHHDDVVDGHFIDCKTALVGLMRNRAVSCEAAADLLLIAKYYERIGDHAVNIAGRLLFAITGSSDVDAMTLRRSAATKEEDMA